MLQIRPELVKGFGLLAMFLGLIITTSFLIPFPIRQSNYVFVDVELANQDPNTFSGQNISSTSTIATHVFHFYTYYHVGTSEGVILHFPVDQFPIEPQLEQGDRVYFRGTYFNNSVFIHEFYVLDYSSSIIRSIPGIVLFVVMFFMVFTFDFKRLVFVRRKGGAEST